MTARAVHFETIELHRVRGIGHGEGFELSKLSPGVNLMHGPNGSGKSTTALVIQELLWSGHTGLERPTVAGRFRDGETNWRIDIDAGHVEITCDGQAGSALELGPPENRQRYHLALHKLIGDDNADFAKAIADASQGGYDLEAAAKDLGFHKRPAPARPESKLLAESRRVLREAGQHQRGIANDASDLPDLREQRNRAAAARDQIQWLDKARQHREARDECLRIESKLGALPAGLRKLRGDEREDLDRLSGQAARLQEELKQEQKRVEQAEQLIRKSGLPAEGLDQQELTTLRGWHSTLKELESEHLRRSADQSKAAEQAERARKNLGQVLGDEQRTALETVEVGELSVFSRSCDQVRAREAVLEERRRQLARVEATEVDQLEGNQIQAGLLALTQWLASPASTGQGSSLWNWPLTVAAALIVALGCVLASVHHLAWLTTVPVALGLALWSWWLRRSPAESARAGQGSVPRENYELTGLEPPVAWRRKEVGEQVHRLVRLAGIRSLEDERRRRLGDLRTEADRLAEKCEELDGLRHALEERTGLRIEVKDEWLSLLIDNIGTWQRQNAEALGAARACADLKERQSELQGRINSCLRGLGVTEIDSAGLADQRIADLTERRTRFNDARTALENARRSIQETLEPGLVEVAGQRKALFVRLGLDESDEQTVDDWLKDHPGYLELKQSLSASEILRGVHRDALARHEELLELEPAEIDARIQQQQELAGNREELTDRIAAIEADIRNATSRHDLSDALAHHEAAADTLFEARDQNGSALVGALLTDWVRVVANERSRPQVFRRANELFVRFTRGALQLELDERANPPAFLARQGGESARPVDQLSIGERVQLLIAVRIAFLEQDERTRLPLLLDEALGTSDDGRAGEIIDAVIQIAREGRQVFYFTAQHDEVGKWLARLNDSGTPHRVIDLAQVRRLSAAASSPLIIERLERPRPPAPEGMTHDRYGQVLEVPNLDPAASGAQRLHLWHVVEDVDLLYRLLCDQIDSWSQLRTLLDHNGAGLVDVGNGQFQTVAATARAVEAGCRAWRIGRGRKLDRHALLDSECVSDSFIDRLSDLARRVDGDALALLAALEEGKVARWRAPNTEKLREFFETKGFLCAESPLSTQDIRVRVLAAVADDLKQGRLDAATIDRIVGCLPKAADR